MRLFTLSKHLIRLTCDGIRRQLIRFILLFLFLTGAVYILPAQKIHRFQTKELELIYFGDRYSYLMPHVARTFHNALGFHKKHWNYPHKKTYVLLTDFEDDGHGGAIVMPDNTIVLGIAPFNFAFSIVPSNERFQWLFSHEFTHITMADKANKRDMFWRGIFLGKIRRDEEIPVSALWSYLTTPRWYAPRWYHEGIACYMETWMSGGLGRALGPYDEMYFRSIVNEGYPIYSVIGLETEGSTIDFQVGANAYLYGTRFVTWLSREYGHEKLRDFYMRSDNSKAFYGRQFKKVYGKSIRKSWNEWTSFEMSFQKRNLERIKEYPLTPFRPLSREPMGSVSVPAYDSEDSLIYAAVNYPGKISHIAAIDLRNGKARKVAVLDSPILYSVTFLAYDPVHKRIFISEQNNKYRSLVQVDASNGKKTKLIKYSRVGNLVYDTVHRCLWGVRHDNAYATLVKIPEPFTEVIPMYTADFGKSLLDLAVSNDASMISGTLTGIGGEQSLVLFHTDDLEIGVGEYRTILELEDNTLTQFRFSNDDRYLIGTSYYTGVSNVWRIDLESEKFELLSNDESGLFMPVQISKDSLFVLKFTRNGMLPGIIPVKVVEDANAIHYLGNDVIDKNPELVSFSLPPASRINIDSLELDEKPYYPLRNMSLTSAYPDIAGFKKTIALGYRLNWHDRVGLSNLSLFVSGSPWSNYPERQKLHLDVRWDFWLWTLSASYNKTNFYDLFGPIRRSRAGYSIGISHKKSFNMRKPFSWYYGFGISHYGDLEVLPQFQNVASPLKSFQSLSAEVGLSKLRKSLGAVDDEKGYSWELTAYTYLAKGSFYPSLVTSQNVGWLLPLVRNTSFWIRSSLGQSLGKKGSSFSSFYFGGFRNNYVDWQEPQQYRKVLAFPGVDIDALRAHNFIKTLAELNLRPVRFRNFGFTWLYPTFMGTSLFGTHIMLNPDCDALRQNVFNAGLQFNLEVVLFSYLKTTWSAGYARKMEASLGPEEQWMFSLKLLGN